MHSCTPKRFQLKWWHLVVVVLSSCRSIQPESPVITVVPQPKLEKANNRIVVPLEIDLTTYLNEAKSQVPESYLGANKQCEGTAYDMYFERTKVQIEANNNLLQTTIDGKYWIKMSYCAKCSDLFTDKPVCISPRIPFSCGVGEPMPKLKMTLSTSISFTKDFHLKTNTSLTNITPVNRCEVTLFHFDITETLMEEMNLALNKEMTNLDKSLGKISFANTFNELWFGIQKPIRIPTLGYLHFRPTQIALTEPILINNRLKTSLVINSTSYVNHQSTSAEINKLPELKKIPTAPIDTFDLHTDFELSYDSISRLFTNYMNQKPIEIKNKKIIIDSVKLSCLNQNELLIQLDFSGSKRGTMFLRGTPQISATDQVFSLEGLSFDIKTKNVLLKSASWLFNDKILHELKNACTISLKFTLNNLKLEIDRQLDFKIGGFSIVGKSIDLSVETIVPTTESLMFRTLFRGKIQVRN